MKRKLRYVSLMLAFVFVLNCSVGAINTVSNTSDVSKRNQDAALNAYDKLAHYLGLDELEEDEEVIWPEEYAGCYINDDDELVVCLVENTPTMQVKYSIICETDVLFQDAEYSKRDVEELYEILSQNENVDELLAVYSSRFNKVQLWVNDETTQAELEQYISEYIESNLRTNTYSNWREQQIDWSGLVEYKIDDNILSAQNISTVEESDDALEVASTLSDEDEYGRTYIKPGSRITNQNPNQAARDIFSVGVWATRYINNISVLGVITCGHAFYDSNSVYNATRATVYIDSSTRELGIASESNVLYGVGNSAYDFAFIVPSNLSFQTYVPTSEAVNGERITSLYSGSGMPEGTIVTVGQKILQNNLVEVTGVVAGDQTIIGNGGSISTGILVDHGSSIGTYKGDSGGAVYVKQNGVNKLVGFVSSGFDQRTIYVGGTPYMTYRYTAVAKANLAFSAFGATLYTGTGSEFDFYG
ncbi:MAG: hypothetical protein PUB32_04730 [Clostridiales bacterium]|nr:hypothetical protein [Clostridiales bacterium]